MVALHMILAAVATAASLVVIVSAIWSAVVGRRSGGRRDHRSALDRAVLVVLASVLSAGLLGVILLLAGSKPADPLHVIYGPAALIALPVAIWIGARGMRADSPRLRRDVWTAAGAMVLLGIVLRLYATG